MSPEDANSAALAGILQFIRMEIEAAVKAEREACAKIAESVPTSIDGIQRNPEFVRFDIEAAIKARP